MKWSPDGSGNCSCSRCTGLPSTMCSLFRISQKSLHVFLEKILSQSPLQFVPWHFNVSGNLGMLTFFFLERKVCQVMDAEFRWSWKKALHWNICDFCHLGTSDFTFAVFGMLLDSSVKVSSFQWWMWRIVPFPLRCSLQFWCSYYSVRFSFYHKDRGKTNIICYSLSGSLCQVLSNIFWITCKRHVRHHPH